MARIIIHRRHTMRTKPGQHLSQAGVELARRVGEGMPAFDQVVTSTIPRAFETAIAMGYAVDRQDEVLATMPEGKEVEWDAGFAEHAKSIREQPAGIAAGFAGVLTDLHLQIARALPDNGRALIISHGGFIEPAAIGCVPDQDFASWGPACNYCEGIQLTFEGDTFSKCDLLRVEGSILLN